MQRTLFLAAFTSVVALVQQCEARPPERNWRYVTPTAAHAADCAVAPCFSLARLWSENARSIGGGKEVILEITLAGVSILPDEISVAFPDGSDVLMADGRLTIQLDEGPVERRECWLYSSLPDRLGFNDDGFIARLKAAKRLVVSVNVRGHGPREFSFNVSGLVWK